MHVQFLTSFSSWRKSRFVFCFENYRHILEQIENKNVWAKLDKKENLISSYYSRNGESWFQVGQPAEISNLCRKNSQLPNENFAGNSLSTKYEADKEDWLLCAGSKFKNNPLKKKPHSLLIKSSFDLKSGSVEVWVDSFDVNNKVAEFMFNGALSKTTHEKTGAKIFHDAEDKYDLDLHFNNSVAEILF